MSSKHRSWWSQNGPALCQLQITGKREEISLFCVEEGPSQNVISRPAAFMQAMVALFCFVQHGFGASMSLWRNYSKPPAQPREINSQRCLTSLRRLSFVACLAEYRKFGSVLGATSASLVCAWNAGNCYCSVVECSPWTPCGNPSGSKLDR